MVGIGGRGGDEPVYQFDWRQQIIGVKTGLGSRETWVQMLTLPHTGCLFRAHGGHLINGSNDSNCDALVR